VRLLNYTPVQDGMKESSRTWTNADFAAGVPLQASRKVQLEQGHLHGAARRSR
jgi:hypothetical protein